MFICLLPLSIDTYSQPKIETKEHIESQINRDGFVFIRRTASNRAGKETGARYKMYILKALTIQDQMKRKSSQCSIYSHEWLIQDN